MVQTYRRWAKGYGGTKRRTPPKSGLSERQKNAVNRMIIAKKEMNFFDVAANSSEITSTPDIDLLSTVPQGDGEQQRLRDKLQLCRLKFKYLISPESGAASSTVHEARIIIFQWRPDTANETPSANDLMVTTTQPITMLTNDPAKRRKFKILYDKYHCFNSFAATSGHSLTEREVNIKLKGSIKFNESATTGSNHIYVLMGGAWVAGNENMNVKYTSRLYYHD